MRRSPTCDAFGVKKSERDRVSPILLCFIVSSSLDGRTVEDETAETNKKSASLHREIREIRKLRESLTQRSKLLKRNLRFR